MTASASKVEPPEFRAIQFFRQKITRAKAERLSNDAPVKVWAATVPLEPVNVCAGTVPLEPENAGTPAGHAIVPAGVPALTLLFVPVAVVVGETPLPAVLLVTRSGEAAVADALTALPVNVCVCVPRAVPANVGTPAGQATVPEGVKLTVAFVPDGVKFTVPFVPAGVTLSFPPVLPMSACATRVPIGILPSSEDSSE